MFVRGVIVLLCVLVAVSDGLPEPGYCPKIYSPVCGSNGITYDNACLLHTANFGSDTKIVVVKQGRCDEDLQE